MNPLIDSLLAMVVFTGGLSTGLFVSGKASMIVLGITITGHRITRIKQLMLTASVQDIEDGLSDAVSIAWTSDLVRWPAFLTRPVHKLSSRLIRKPDARFQSNTVSLVRRYFVPCTSVASLRTHVDETRPCVSPFGCIGILIRSRRISPSNHSYCYAFQSSRALRNTTDAPDFEILVRNAG